MKRFILCFVAVIAAITMYGVPAYPGWQTKTLADGTTIEMRQVGDEFCSYWASKDGKLVLEQADGTFVKSDKALPTKEEFQARRTRAREMRVEAPELAQSTKRVKKAVGTTPNLAPRGVVILVNFSDSEMKEDHTQAVFDNMCNAPKGQCTTNAYKGVNYGSAAQYFADQSNGAYRPIFDVIGPVTLPNETAYYGEDGPVQKDGSRAHDIYIADFVIDAIVAAEELGCDFSQYDSDNDGYVDFVYFIYAGKNQAYWGGDETIWPHNSDLWSLLAYGYTHGTSEYYINLNNQGYITSLNVPRPDGKYVRNYACSSELDGYGNLGGIGTLCHEFGHVMGLPDFYDTEYGEISDQGLTPGNWNIMDAGSYNGDMHCPPCYDPWEKYFFGWIDPVNPGKTGRNGTLYANGTADYNVYQINSSGSKKGATTEGLCYYLENRQQTGWDTFLPGHGLVAWKVDFKANVWERNAPNASSTSGAPLYTVELVEGGSWNAISNRPVTNVKEENGVVTFDYMGGAVSSSCAVPTDLQVAIEDTTIIFSWEGEADGYEIRYLEGEYTEEEDELFSGTTSFDGTLAGWTTIDADGDGHTWAAESGYAYSESFSNDLRKALTPDNYLVSPKIRLGGSISFYASGASTWCAEHFGVAVSTKSNTDAADFTMVSQEWIADSVWTKYTVDLSAYSGTGYVAIRHFNITDMYILAVAEIEITAPEGEKTVESNAWNVISGISAKEYSFTDWKDSTLYTIQVRSQCGDEYSPWSPSEIFTTPVRQPDTTWINWQYYDDGKFSEAIGAEGTKFYWGIMLPAGQDHNALTKVAIYERPDNNKQPITIDVYEGIETDAGSQKKPALKLYTETVQPAAGDSFHIITLADTVFFDSTKELWIILSEGTDTHPATTCANTGDANGRWVSLDGVKWEDLALDYSLDFTFMIRAYCERLEQPQEQGVEDLSTNNNRPTTKILRDGQLLILRDGKTYNVLGTLTTND